MKNEISHQEAIESIAFRVREALAAKQTTTAGRDFYRTADLLAALNDILAVTRAAGVAQD